MDKSLKDVLALANRHYLALPRWQRETEKRLGYTLKIEEEYQSYLYRLEDICNEALKLPEVDDKLISHLERVINYLKVKE
jgi:hypothetical protein